MTTGSVDSGGTAAAWSGSLLCAICLVLSVFLIDLDLTVTVGTDKFLSPFSLVWPPPFASGPALRIVAGRDAPGRIPGGVGATA
jgi:hypothetical protein